MNTAVFNRRRVERLARLLDESAGPGRHHAPANSEDELARLVTMCHRVSTIPLTAVPGDQFRDSLRAMLVATAERDGIGRTDRQLGAVPQKQTSATPASGWRSSRTRGAILVGVAAGAVALSGMSTASNGALPGDPLYGVKRSTEKAQLALAGSDISRGQLYLEFAQTRLTEAKAVHDDAGQVISVLSDMDSETRLGVRLLATAAVEHRDSAALDAVDRFADTQRTGLFDTTRILASSAVQEALESLALLDQVGERVDQLRSAMACGSGTADRTDAIGPVPVPCEQPAAPAESQLGSEVTVDPTPTPSRTPSPSASSHSASPTPSPTSSPSATPSTTPTVPSTPVESPSAGAPLNPDGTPTPTP